MLGVQGLPEEATARQASNIEPNSERTASIPGDRRLDLGRTPAIRLNRRDRQATFDSDSSRTDPLCATNPGET